jgi:hypothetical protein
MTKRSYTAEEKIHALSLLAQNGGDILRTSVQTGIPDRTLYTWYRRYRAENQQRNVSVSPPIPPSIDLDNKLDTLSFLRRQMMTELFSLASTIGSGAELANPYQRARALAQLVDKLMQIDIYLRQYTPPESPFGFMPFVKPTPESAEAEADDSESD